MEMAYVSRPDNTTDIVGFGPNVRITCEHTFKD